MKFMMCFLNDPEWTFEHFCQKTPRAVKFDLITCLHSWYLIDPVFLIDAYRRLSEHGILIVSLGPHWKREKSETTPGCEGNFINTVTSAIDEVLAAHLRRNVREDAYSEKVIRDDPYRNYAEDVEKAFGTFFGTSGVDFFGDYCDRWVPGGSILKNNELTSVGKEIVDFFLHGLSRGVDKDALFEKIHQQLKQLEHNGQLPACEWDFSIDRAQVAKRRRDELRFSPRGQDNLKPELTAAGLPSCLETNLLTPGEEADEAFSLPVSGHHLWHVQGRIQRLFVLRQQEGPLPRIGTN